MPPLKNWRARFANIRFAGRYSLGSGSAETLPRGTMVLHFRILDAGKHTGRDVEVEVMPDQLETVVAMGLKAIAIRDGREA